MGLWVTQGDGNVIRGNEWSDNVFEKDNEIGANAGPGVGCVQ